MCRSCRTRLEAHNARQRERWTAAGASKRRSRQDEMADSHGDGGSRQPAMPAALELQHSQLSPNGYAAAPAEQARAAVAALFGVPVNPTHPLFVTPVQQVCSAAKSVVTCCCHG